MEAKYNLSSQEYEIMSILWKENREMTLAEIADLLWDAGFEISIGTVKTYLQRIVKKGALIAPKHGHKLMYMPSSSEEGFCPKMDAGFSEQKLPWFSESLYLHFDRKSRFI